MTAGATLMAGESVLERVVGRIDQGRDGPTFLAQGGIHGNEPAGVQALTRVLEEIRSRDLQVFGRIVACRGNLTALARAERFVNRDLNRSWLANSVTALQGRDALADDTEDREQRELLTLYEECWVTRRGPLVFLDLHSSSAPGPPFSCMADTLPNRRIADALPIPMILGLEECIDGAVMEWFNQRGQLGLAIEGGQHDHPSTIDNLESAVWLALAACGVIARADVDRAHHEDRLRKAARGAPHLLEVTYRHIIRREDRFGMVPGFVSFQPVTKGDLLAHDHHGPVRATGNGMVLLPLYQGLGEDGFFLGRRVPRFWFALSGMLRKAKLSPLLRFLPGVSRDPECRNTLLANPRVARFLVTEVFHLFGYRRERARGNRLAFSRRWASSLARCVRPR